MGTGVAMSLNKNSARVIAFYLPQFHPIPENDEWWGNGFTEWTNVAKAKPLFRGHYQPHVPADLGFYDLRVPETRIAQAELAREYGIEAFCYYHYWFAGKRLLERPFTEVLESGEPDFPFCLCWANETWTGVWHGAPNRILIEQKYPGTEDDIKHFYTLLAAFEGVRYVKVEGKPIFIIYEPQKLPNPRQTIDCWRELAHRAGLKGLYIVGIENEPWKPEDNGFDASTPRNLSIGVVILRNKLVYRVVKNPYRRLLHYPLKIYPYEKVYPYFLLPGAEKLHHHPCVIPNWDNTPRSGLSGLVLHGSNPELFRNHLKSTLTQIKDKPFEYRLVFIKSWNEWAEGNHLEPDLKYGKAYLKVLRDEVSSNE